MYLIRGGVESGELSFAESELLAICLVKRAEGTR